MKVVLFGAAAAMVLSSTALAADLPAQMRTKAPPMVVDPAYNWSGFYVGLNAGYAWSASNTSMGLGATPFVGNPANIAAFIVAGTQALRGGNFTGGGQLGYNFQVAPNWLWGVETDVQYVGFNRTLSTNFIQPVGAVPGNVTENVKSDWLWTLRGRAGFIVNRSLFYVTGGLAVANVGFSQIASFNNGATLNAGSVSATKYGWTAGAGWEYAFASNWSAKIEYLYASFGDVGFVSSNTFTGGQFTHSANLNENLVRAGLNYKLSSPVVAKY